jgi:ATP-dependent Lon protease
MNHLEYPITKAQLLKGYEIKEQIRDKLKKEYIEKYLKEQLDFITSNIIKKTFSSPNEYKTFIDIIEKKNNWSGWM